MSEISDVVVGGWWPLRHHATVDAALRYVRMACLVRADQGAKNTGPLKFGRDRFGRIREVDGSAGDVQGGLIWEADKPVVPLNRGQMVQEKGDPPARDFPSLGFAFPAVVQAPPEGTAVSTGGLPWVDPGTVLPAGVTTSRPPGSTSSDGSPPAFPPNVKLRPIQDEKITADQRYVELTAACLPGSVPGTTGIVLAATHERRMEPLFFASNSPLIAVNRAGDPATSSLVFDELPNGKPDPKRYAPLHSAWRVIRLATACAPGLTASASKRGQLAWQLGGGGRDGLAGYGLAYDATGGATGGTAPSTKPSSDPNQAARDAILKQLARIEQQIAAAEAAGSAGAHAVGDLVDQRNTLMRQLAALPGGSGTQNKPAPSTAGGSSGVIGAFSWHMGGPLDPGGPGCQHPIGRTFDGEQAYSGHVPVNAYFRGAGGDGPLLFETMVAAPKSGPYQMKVHLVWNPALTHPHPCGPKLGKWWWFAEAMDYLTNEPPPTFTMDNPNVTQDGGGSQTQDGGGDGGLGTDTFGGGRPSRGQSKGGSGVLGPGSRDPHQPVQGGGLPGGGGGGGGSVTGGPGDDGLPPDTGGLGPPSGGNPHPFGPGGGFVDGGGLPGGLALDTGLGGWKGAYVCEENKPKNKRWRATSLLGVSPGQVFRPQDLTLGRPDYRTVSRDATGPLSADQIASADAAPATLRIEAFAERSHGQWDYGINPNVSHYSGGSTAAGGVWIGPADRDLKNEVNGTPYVRTPVQQTFFMFHPSVQIGTGTFFQDGSNYPQVFNPLIAMPQATTPGYIPRSLGDGAYTWVAPTSVLGSALFGDGSDGAATINGGTTTLTRDMFYTTLHVTGTGVLVTNGFRIFANVSVTVDASGLIHNNGTVGNDNSGVSGGAGQVGGGQNALAGGSSGGNGSTVSGSPQAGAGQSRSLGGNGGAGGPAIGGGAGGVATAPTASNGGIRAASLAIGAYFMSAAQGVNPLGAGAGGGGGGASTNGGGGGGGGGGVVIVVAPSIVNNGTIESLGGGGGNNVGGTTGSGGGGGGGGVVIIIGSLTGSGSTSAAGGVAGTGLGPATNGSPGTVITIPA